MADSGEPEVEADGIKNTSAKDELAKIVATCLEALSEQAEIEKSLEKDVDFVERTLRQLEGRRGNEPVTAEVGQTFAHHLRQAINGNRVNAQVTHVLMLLILKVTLLAQKDAWNNVENLEEARRELDLWFEQWKSANEAWTQYTG